MENPIFVIKNKVGGGKRTFVPSLHTKDGLKPVNRRNLAGRLFVLCMYLGAVGIEEGGGGGGGGVCRTAKRYSLHGRSSTSVPDNGTERLSTRK